jgi:hypothetical protein
MADFDASSYAGDLLGWRSELAARVRDILARKAGPDAQEASLSSRLRAIAERIESAASLAGLKRALSDLLARCRRPAGAAASSVEAAAGQEALHARIRAHGMRESIESYPDYLFTVQITL